LDRYSLVYSAALEGRIHDAYLATHSLEALTIFAKRTFVFKLGWFITSQVIIDAEQEVNLPLQKRA